MPFEKGKERTGGRQKGTPNKATMAAKQAFQHAFDSIGGAEALAEWAKKNQLEFYKLYSRLIPLDYNVGGQPANPVKTDATVTLTPLEAYKRMLDG